MSHEGHEWQVGIWDRMADVYENEIDKRFVPVIEYLLEYAKLAPGEDVLDLGTGTLAVAILAAEAVAPGGDVTAVDISSEAVDVVLASLSLMYVLDRAAAAREIARVLRPKPGNRRCYPSS